jgi:hypothetical protein
VNELHAGYSRDRERDEGHGATDLGHIPDGLLRQVRQLSQIPAVKDLIGFIS